MDFFQSLFSLLALVISVLTYYLNRPKLIIEREETTYDRISEDDNHYYPNFVMRIKNLRNIAISIDSISIILGERERVSKDLNLVVKPFSVMNIYIGNSAISYLVKSKETEVKNFKRFYKHIGIEGNFEDKILEKNYPVLNGLLLPKQIDGRPVATEKPEEIEIEINTSWKKYRRTIRFVD
ncbi:hypothetical protein GF357_02245 [Candidatus Dojkabacteria bacterium]|nr:hypothetical protein [Candidatus Dojkabacteria bacterium]